MASQRRGFAPGLQKICRSPCARQSGFCRSGDGFGFGEGMASFQEGRGSNCRRTGSGRGRQDFVPTRGTLLLPIFTAGASKWGTSPQVRGYWWTHPPQLESHLLKLIFVPPAGCGARLGKVLPRCPSSLSSATLGRQLSPSVFFLPFPWQTLMEEGAEGRLCD